MSGGCWCYLRTPASYKNSESGGGAKQPCVLYCHGSKAFVADGETDFTKNAGSPKNPFVRAIVDAGICVVASDAGGETWCGHALVCFEPSLSLYSNPHRNPAFAAPPSDRARRHHTSPHTHTGAAPRRFQRTSRSWRTSRGSATSTRRRLAHGAAVSAVRAHQTEPPLYLPPGDETRFQGICSVQSSLPDTVSLIDAVIAPAWNQSQPHPRRRDGDELGHGAAAGPHRRRRAHAGGAVVRVRHRGESPGEPLSSSIVIASFSSARLRGATHARIPLQR